MGREALTQAQWRGETAEVKALLESAEIILRGAMRVRILRTTITRVRAEDGALIVEAGTERLVLDLGPAEASKWAAILHTPPTLAHKLGVDADRPAFLVGEVDDPALAAALDNATVPTPAEATVLLAVLRVADDLDGALRVAQAQPPLPIWCVYVKGKKVGVTDAAVRLLFRSAGYVDTKACAVSHRWTATRYTSRL